MNKKGFTLAEVLITLAIIGVVAAMAIPSVISNAQQQEFKTGLRKAVSVLNSAITMNIALEGETPYDNGDLFHYLQRHMSVMKSTTILPWAWEITFENQPTRVVQWGVPTESRWNNAAFYTTDGIRFEFWYDNTMPYPNGSYWSTLHESDVKPNIITARTSSNTSEMRCGSYGLANNPNNTTATPCRIMVDVNGDRKPYPANVNALEHSDNKISIPTPNSKKLKDTFAILITEDRAMPFGILAQKAMYQAQK